MALDEPWAFSATFLNSKRLGFQSSAESWLCSFYPKKLNMKAPEKTRLWLFSVTIALSLPRRFPHHLRDFIYLSQPHLSSKRRNFAQSLYSLKDSIWTWYCAQKSQIKFYEILLLREGWSCYYLCQCLDWNLFSINYLEDLHKLLPS